MGFSPSWHHIAIDVGVVYGDNRRVDVSVVRCPVRFGPDPSAARVGRIGHAFIIQVEMMPIQ